MPEICLLTKNAVEVLWIFHVCILTQENFDTIKPTKTKSLGNGKKKQKKTTFQRDFRFSRYGAIVWYTFRREHYCFVL